MRPRRQSQGSVPATLRSSVSMEAVILRMLKAFITCTAWYVLKYTKIVKILTLRTRIFYDKRQGSTMITTKVVEKELFRTKTIL
jgi:hypothetical protein